MASHEINWIFLLDSGDGLSMLLIVTLLFAGTIVFDSWGVLFRSVVCTLCLLMVVTRELGLVDDVVRRGFDDRCPLA